MRDDGDCRRGDRQRVLKQVWPLRAGQEWSRPVALLGRTWHPDLMIGVFDSGHGGLTVLRALVARFPHLRFVYLGDHANVPYGNRASDEIVALTRAGVNALFHYGCQLVLLGCNTATCVAARTLQRGWLPVSGW